MKYTEKYILTLDIGPLDSIYMITEQPLETLEFSHGTVIYPFTYDCTDHSHIRY